MVPSLHGSTGPPSALCFSQGWGQPQDSLARSPVGSVSAGASPPWWPCCALPAWDPEGPSPPARPQPGLQGLWSLTVLCPQVPFPTMVALLCMWFGISLPLVYLGYYFGFRKQPYDNPVRTNQIPRQIPEQRWYMNRFVG